MTNRTEACLRATENVLIFLSSPEFAAEIDRTLSNFFGLIIECDKNDALPAVKGKTVYLCGDIRRIAMEPSLMDGAKRVLIVRELSDFSGISRAECPVAHEIISLGRVPRSVHGMGVFYPHFFDEAANYFSRICDEHKFQALTESNKSGKAHRTGIYLSRVNSNPAGLEFNLLRCSTNLSGPTENFQATDRHIVAALNQEASSIFDSFAELNHVLAQVYHNHLGDNNKQTKAKIKAHADKTKDMPSDGVMAFCTFYDGLEKIKPLETDAFDYGYKGKSGLTKLHFRLKKPARNQESGYPEQFTITLYPNSVFFMPLSTNRLYSHEIRAPGLNADMLPTRLGYVVRCSSTKAVHQGGQTYLKRTEALQLLERPTDEKLDSLRKLYAEENNSVDYIEYGDEFSFSMNDGDYLAPSYKPSDDFPVYQLPIDDNLLAGLTESFPFEVAGKGRQGNIIVLPDSEGRVPIVRTTTRYQIPAQVFSEAQMLIAQMINKHSSLAFKFNNALVERYDERYRKMGFHSDQALDLKEGSSIAVFSCYKHGDAREGLRKLVVQAKDEGQETFEIVLQHNSVVVFDLPTNRRFKHKIVLENPNSNSENEWLGITFRTSKTYVEFKGETPMLAADTPLTLANEAQALEFVQLKSAENNDSDFSYPKLNYTLSPSDLIKPE